MSVINDKHSNMPLRMENFMTDAIILAKIKHSGDLNKMAKSVIDKLVDCYGGHWNVIITKVCFVRLFSNMTKYIWSICEYLLQ